MAKKSNVAPKEIISLMSKIKRAEDIRQKADEKFGFSRALAQYQNDYSSIMPSFLTDTDLVPINEVYAFVKTFVPSVYSRDPHISVSPMNTKSVKGSKIAELMVNSYWRELKLKREVKRCLIDAILAEGWMKCGYSASLGKVARKDDEKPGLESNEFIQSDEIFATRLSWQNMVRDPDAINGIYDARWVAQNIIKPIDAVKNSTLYENTENLQPSFVIRGERKISGVGLKNVPGEDIAYASLWEIWDMDQDKVFTISEGCSEYLMNKDWPYKMQGYPFELVRFNDNPDEAYAPNLIGPWEPQLWEKIKIRAMQLDHLKRYNRQLSVEEGAMSKSEIEKMRLGRTGSITTRKKGSNPPIPLPYPPLQSDIYGIENKIDLDKDNISGQPNAVRSAPQKTQSRTLGEIDNLISAFQSRQSEPQDVIEEFSAGIATKIIGLTQQYLNGEKYVRASGRDIEEIQASLVDENGQSRFDGKGFNFTKKDIQGMEFSVSIKSGSTLPLDRKNRIDSMIAMLKLGPTLGIQPGGLVSRTIGKNMISEFELPEVEAAFDEEQKQIDLQKQIQAKMMQQNNDLAQTKLNNMRAAGPPQDGGQGGM